MHRAAHAQIVEEDEEPVISNELIETHLAALRANVGELKATFGAAIARLDESVRHTAAKFEAEIRALIARAEHDLKALTAKVENDLRDLRADNKSLRDKIDANHADDSARFDVLRDTVADIRAFQKVAAWMLGLIVGGIITMIAKALLT